LHARLEDRRCPLAARNWISEGFLEAKSVVGCNIERCWPTENQVHLK
jgi:hypothetical protein